MQCLRRTHIIYQLEPETSSLHAVRFINSCALQYFYTMAKTGKQKNTKNKSTHSTLMARKINKKRTQKEQRAKMLKEILLQARKANP